MTMTAAIFYPILTLIVFLIVLNGYMRGTKTPIIDAVLSVGLVVILGVGFYLFGWKLGLTNVAISFVLAMILKPLAHRVAIRLLNP